MEEVTQQSPETASPKLTKEQRSKVQSEAASRRWAKVREEKAKAAKAAQKPAAKPVAKPKSQNRSSGPKEFSSALRTAEKRLSQAILERSKAANTYAVLSAEIPSLQRLIVALKNPLGLLPEYGVSLAPSLEQIVGDQPLDYANPPRRNLVPVPPVMPVPQELHPANTVTRGGGGAIGVELPEGAEDEDQFLRESAIAGGNWH